MNLKRSLLAVALLLVMPANAAEKSIGSEIETKTLDNGLKIIVWPDHDIPNVAMFNWVRAGGRNEYPGITGLSHFFEHMMFNGSEKYGPGEFDRVMEANGGANNAYTSSDVTVYQDWFPVSALEVIFELEADRIGHLAIDREVVESERGVVYSERRLRVDNSNFGQLFEQTQATAFVAHPYQFPVIGWPSDIEGWKYDDLVEYFRTYYAPNNLTLVVVGDVTPEQIFELSKKHFGPIPAQDPPDPVTTREPEQRGERRLIIEKDAQVAVLQMAYHIGNARDEDFEAVELLMSVLTDGNSSRLYRRLVDQDQLAISVGGFSDEGFDPGLAWIYATLAANVDPGAAEKAIDQELALIRENGPTEIELRKAKNIYLAGFWRTLKTISGKAQALGSYEVFHGDYKELFSAPDAFEAVTADDVRRVARKILTERNRTVGTLMPVAETADEPVEGESR